jgi:sulfur carrier protein
MRVVVNGNEKELAPGSTIAAIVELLALAGKRMAVEVNEEVIPRSEHANYVLHEGDIVEVVHAVGGG